MVFKVYAATERRLIITHLKATFTTIIMPAQKATLALIIQPVIKQFWVSKTWYLALDGVDSLSKSLDVGRGDTSNRDTSILSSINAVLLRQLIHLLGGQSGVRKHADLGGDVVPVLLAAELLKVVLEERAHLDDAVGHALHLAEPLLVELWVVENLGGDAGAVDWWVGV